MKLMMNEPLKALSAFFASLFDGSAAIDRCEFEREFSSSQRTARIRTWEYRNDRF